MQTFNNWDLGVAVMIEPLSGGYAGYKLTHATFDANTGENQRTVEVRKYPAGKQGDAIAYAKLCTGETFEKGAYLTV